MEKVNLETLEGLDTLSPLEEVTFQQHWDVLLFCQLSTREFSESEIQDLINIGMETYIDYHPEEKSLYETVLVKTFQKEPVFKFLKSCPYASDIPETFQLDINGIEFGNTVLLLPDLSDLYYGFEANTSILPHCRVIGNSCYVISLEKNPRVILSGNEITPPDQEIYDYVKSHLLELEFGYSSWLSINDVIGGIENYLDNSESIELHEKLLQKYKE